MTGKYFPYDYINDDDDQSIPVRFSDLEEKENGKLIYKESKDTKEEDQRPEHGNFTELIEH